MGGFFRLVSKPLVVASTLAVILTAGGCGDLEDVSQAVNVKLDPSLSGKEKELLRSDVLAMVNYQVNADQGSWYHKAFGGQDSVAALRYMDDRINYVLSEDVKLDSRLKVGEYANIAQRTQKVMTMASNVGTVLWFVQELNRPYNLSFKMGSAKVPLDSSRVGIIQLGAGYTAKKTSTGAPITSIIRTGTLIHEARHSDCTGGMKKTDLDKLKNGILPDKGMSCGHLHTLCPTGHDLAGYYACDALAWGAYSIGALYEAAIARSCGTCSETERQQALAAASNSFDRVLVLQDMLAGRLGDPDMSSSSSISLRQIKEMLKKFREAREEESESRDVTAEIL